MVVKENSDVIKRILTTLINISGRKTTEGHAVYIMDSLLKKLKETYEFLKFVEVNDTRFIEEGDFITVMSDVDSISSDEIGKAIHDIIFTMNDVMGRDAGHFFVKEISRNIGSEYYSTMSDMGVDLSLMQLEHEVHELEKKILKPKKPID